MAQCDQVRLNADELCYIIQTNQARLNADELCYIIQTNQARLGLVALKLEFVVTV